MRHFVKFKMMIIGIISMFATTSHAQYRNVSVNSTTVSFVKIVEVVQSATSTFFYMTATAKNDDLAITMNPKTNIVIGYKKYRLKNAYNITSYNEAEPSFLLLDKKGQEHNFILEFPRIPLDQTFDIIEEGEDSNPWKWMGVKVDMNDVSDVIEPSDFISVTPQKIKGMYAVEGTVYTYYINDGLVLTANFAKNKAYGKYYTVYLDIINNTGHSVAFNTTNVGVQGYTMKNNEPTFFALETLTADEYDKKVRTRQAWNSFLTAFSAFSAASNAGTTTINNTTTTSSHGSSHTDSGYSGGAVSASAVIGTGGAAVGVGASAYAGTGYSDTYYSGTTTTNSSTVIHDGAIEYMAQREAYNNIAAYNQDLADDRANLWNNYLKVNTIKTGQKYGGFFNIKYKKATGIIIDIKIDGVVYRFDVTC